MAPYLLVTFILFGFNLLSIPADPNLLCFAWWMWKSCFIFILTSWTSAKLSKYSCNLISSSSLRSPVKSVIGIRFSCCTTPSKQLSTMIMSFICLCSDISATSFTGLSKTWLNTLWSRWRRYLNIYRFGSRMLNIFSAYFSIPSVNAIISYFSFNACRKFWAPGLTSISTLNSWLENRMLSLWTYSKLELGWKCCFL